MGEVVLVNKQKITRFTMIVHNLATLPGQITPRNRDLLAKVTKNLEINIRFVVIQGYSRVSDKVISHFSKTLSNSIAFEPPHKLI